MTDTWELELASSSGEVAGSQCCTLVPSRGHLKRICRPIRRNMQNLRSGSPPYGCVVGRFRPRKNAKWHAAPAARQKPDPATPFFKLGHWGDLNRAVPLCRKEHIANMEQTWYEIPVRQRIAKSKPNLPPPVCPARESPP